jgi:hypothetical protein
LHVTLEIIGTPLPFLQWPGTFALSMNRRQRSALLYRHLERMRDDAKSRGKSLKN